MTACEIAADTWRLLPGFSPLKAFRNGIRASGVTRGGKLFWTEALPAGSLSDDETAIRFQSGEFKRAASAQDVPHDAFFCDVTWTDASGDQHLFQLGVPRSGFQGDVDWQIALKWHAEISQSTETGIWHQWVVGQARQAWGEEGIQWELADIQGVHRSSGGRLGGALDRRTSLWLETGPACVWQVFGLSTSISHLKHALFDSHSSNESDFRQHASDRQSDLPMRMSNVPVRWTLSLILPRLTAGQLQQVETGCLIFSDSMTAPKADALPVRSALRWAVRASARIRTGLSAVSADAAMTLILDSGVHQDNFALQWDALMPVNDKQGTFGGQQQGTRSQDSELNNHITAQLNCVIGSLDIPLSDLLNLRPGQLLPLHDFPLPHVQLMIGQQVVGTGELVRCGQTLAVQIIEWQSDAS